MSLDSSETPCSDTDVSTKPTSDHLFQASEYTQERVLKSRSKSLSNLDSFKEVVNFEDFEGFKEVANFDESRDIVQLGTFTKCIAHEPSIISKSSNSSTDDERPLRRTRVKSWHPSVSVSVAELELFLPVKKRYSCTFQPFNPFKYGRLQRDGELREKLMSDLDLYCRVQPTTLTFEAIGKQSDTIYIFPAGLPPGGFQRQAISLGIPHNNNRSDMSSVSINVKFPESNSWPLPDDESEYCWGGRIGKGVVYIHDMIRLKGSGGPYASEITKAVYEKKYPIETLKHVYMVDVRDNPEATDFIKNQLYSSSKGLSWPDTKPRSWEIGTPEYQALLGTQLGKTMVYLVLGAFARGTREITRVVTWQSKSYKTRGYRVRIHMRFDIDLIPPVDFRSDDSMDDSRRGSVVSQRKKLFRHTTCKY